MAEAPIHVIRFAASSFQLPTFVLSSLKQFLRALAFLRHKECLDGMAELVREVQLRQQVMRDHPGVVIEQDVMLLGYRADRLNASKARVSRGTILSFGDDVTGYGEIAIGKETWIGQYNNLRASAFASIVIGKDCLVSQYCTLVAANHQINADQPIRLQPQSTQKIGVTLGDDVWLGVGVTVLPGVSIGNGAIVGAGSVVTKSIPGNEVWCGVPAMKISQRPRSNG